MATKAEVKATRKCCATVFFCFFYYFLDAFLARNTLVRIANSQHCNGREISENIMKGAETASENRNL